MVLALTSTKFPMCTSSPSTDAGRILEYGPIRHRPPISASSRCEKGATTLPAPIRTLFRRQCAPIDTESPSVTAPSKMQLMSIATSFPQLSVPRTSIRSGSALQRALGSGKLGTIIDALDFHRIGCRNCDDRDAIAHGQGNDVGEVVLALRVVTGQTRKPLREAPGGSREHAGVDFANRA